MIARQRPGTAEGFIFLSLEDETGISNAIIRPDLYERNRVAVTRGKFHDRMPLILKRSDWQRWLEPGNVDQPPVDLLRPFDAELMKAWRADTSINSVRNTGPELGEPLKDDGDAGQMGMFEL